MHQNHFVPQQPWPNSTWGLVRVIPPQQLLLLGVSTLCCECLGLVFLSCLLYLGTQKHGGPHAGRGAPHVYLGLAAA